jgi:hypothetical protein
MASLPCGVSNSSANARASHPSVVHALAQSQAHSGSDGLTRWRAAAIATTPYQGPFAATLCPAQLVCGRNWLRGRAQSCLSSFPSRESSALRRDRDETPPSSRGCCRRA